MCVKLSLKDYKHSLAKTTLHIPHMCDDQMVHKLWVHFLHGSASRSPSPTLFPRHKRSGKHKEKLDKKENKPLTDSTLSATSPLMEVCIAYQYIHNRVTLPCDKPLQPIIISSSDPSFVPAAPFDTPDYYVLYKTLVYKLMAARMSKIREIPTSTSHSFIRLHYFYLKRPFF